MLSLGVFPGDVNFDWLEKMITERIIYKNTAHYLINLIFFPIKMVVPQPVVSMIPGMETNQAIRTRMVLSEVKGKLLDIGCGPNLLVKEYRLAGGEGIGTDVYDWGDVDLLVDDTSNLPLSDNCIDTVTFVACLNHIPNRENVLKEALRVLSPGGRIIVTNLTPWISKIWHKWAFWDNDQHERGMVDGEVYGFTDRQLRRLFDEVGIQIEEYGKFSWNLNNIYLCKKKSTGFTR